MALSQAAQNQPPFDFQWHWGNSAYVGVHPGYLVQLIHCFMLYSSVQGPAQQALSTGNPNCSHSCLCEEAQYMLRHTLFYTHLCFYAEPLGI